jgi:hypothetical protein
MSGRYWRHVLIGLVICGIAVVAFDWGLYHVIRTGSCGTDENGFSIGPPCPPETGGHILAMIGGVFAGLAGIAIYGTRGEGGRPSGAGLGAVMWCLLFLGATGAIALATFGPASTSEAGGKITAVVLGAIFLPMGLAPIPFLLRTSTKKQLALDLMTRGRRCTGEVVSVDDTGITINDNPHVKITVRAEPTGEPPFTIVKTATVSRVAIPRRGDRCTVFFDPSDRENRNGITFDPVPGFTPGATGPVTTATFSGPISPTTATAGPDYTLPFRRPGEEDDGDALAKLERLGELRDKGLITQAEFDDQKRRLLGEL